MKFTPAELKRVEAGLRQVLRSPQLSVRADNGQNAELLMGRDTLGTVYKDDEDGEITYSVTLTLLQDDLPE